VAEKVARAYIRSAIDITGPFGRATLKGAVRKWLPRPLRRWISSGRPDMGPQAMPMPVNCVAFDALVRQVHRIPGGRRVPLPNLGLRAAAAGC
jgi:hypothetical protein